MKNEKNEKKVWLSLKLPFTLQMQQDTLRPQLTFACSLKTDCIGPSSPFLIVLYVSRHEGPPCFQCC
jgi:hypothetical protein